ncbi:hypothetical protein O6H91_10G053500 [Diphasiastrum complanatum]|uniref:Uncharacterized protein n=1 Tax=Diphasiastrum complanatum TaxID=34168 RepID=A0ACC2CI12_DIPCM|nr:hypothetical protein O6H91_10G053500 [Diphasiastrum complanatum]
MPNFFRVATCLHKVSMTAPSYMSIKLRYTLKSWIDMTGAITSHMVACKIYREKPQCFRVHDYVHSATHMDIHATLNSQFVNHVLLTSKPLITVVRWRHTRVNRSIVQPLSAFSGPKRWRSFSLALIGQKSMASEDVKASRRNNSISELSVADDKEIQKVLHCFKQGEWGRSTVSRLEKLNLVLNSTQVAQILKKEKNADRAYGFFKWAQFQETCQLDTLGYSIVIKLLGKNKMLNRMLYLLKEMPEKGLKVPEEVILTVLSSCTTAKRFEEAIEVFCEMERFGCEHSNATYNRFITLLYEAGHVKEADNFLRQMEDRGWYPDISTSSARVNSLSKAGNLDAAYEVFLQMSQKGLLSDTPTYCRLLRRLCSEVRVGSICKLYNQMKLLSIFPDECTYIDLIKGFIKSGNVDDACELFKEMIVAGKSPPTNLSTYVIAALVRLGKMPAASSLLEELIHENILPDASAFRSFVGHLTRAVLIKSAWDLLQELKVRDNEPDMNTYNILVYSFAKILKKGFSDEVTHTIVESGGTSLLLTSNMLIDCLCKAEQDEALWKFYSYMKKIGLDPNVFTYSRVINALAKAGRVDDAYSVFQDLHSKGVSVSKESCIYLLNKFVEIGNRHAAESIQDFISHQYG